MFYYWSHRQRHVRQLLSLHINAKRQHNLHCPWSILSKHTPLRLDPMSLLPLRLQYRHISLCSATQQSSSTQNPPSHSSPNLHIPSPFHPCRSSHHPNRRNQPLLPSNHGLLAPTAMGYTSTHLFTFLQRRWPDRRRPQFRHHGRTHRRGNNHALRTVG